MWNSTRLRVRDAGARPSVLWHAGSIVKRVQIVRDAPRTLKRAPPGWALLSRQQPRQQLIPFAVELAAGDDGGAAGLPRSFERRAVHVRGEG